MIFRKNARRNNNKITLKTEGIHLYGFVRDEDGNAKVIEYYDYPDKKSFEQDLRGNGYTVRRINDNRDMYIMDHSDYLSVNNVKSEIEKLKQDYKYNKEHGYQTLNIDVKSKIERLEKLLDEANKISLTENKLEESDNKIILYHNTTNENAIKISKEGIIPGLRKDVYGKGSEAEGSGVWCSTVRGYGYGGATITFEIDENDRALEKENDTEYMVFRKIEPNEIIDIDLMISDIPCNRARKDSINSTVESDIPSALEYWSKDDILKVFGKNASHFAKPYNLEQLTHLIETGEKYCKGKIKIIESKHKIEEKSRNELLAKTKSQTITRYNKSQGYKGFTIADIDTTSILTTNCFRVTCRVGDYWDTVEMQNILYWIQIEAEKNEDRQINSKGITTAVMNAIDGMDIKVDCSCYDFIYRFAYSATKFRLQVW